MTTISNTLDSVQVQRAESGVSSFKKVSVLLFGIGSYAAGVAVLVGWILYMLGVFEFSGGGVRLEGAAAVLFNLGLMLAFGVQHSAMARQAFKQRWTKLIPAAAERSCYLLATALVLGPTVYFWQPMSAPVWDVSVPWLRVAITAVAVAGWAYLFLASFAINHFELFGLRQVYQYFRGREVTGVPFRERLMYKFDRHPIMSGVLIGMWATPTMRLDHLMFAISATIYVVVGVYFEERALRRRWGSGYDDYCRRVGSLVPSFQRVNSGS